MRIAVTSVVVILLSAGVGGAREWKDVSGKFATEAEFQRMERNDVVLKKPDGSTVKIPFTRLSKSDQECVRELVGVKNRAGLAAGVKVVFEKGRAETQAKTLLLEADAASQLAERFNSRRVTLRFPIGDVHPREPPIYRLVLGKPDFPTEMQYSYAGYFELPLSNRSILTINKQSLLVVMGDVLVDYDGEAYRQWVRTPPSPTRTGARSRVENKNQNTLHFLLGFTSPTTDKELKIYLLSMTHRIQNPDDEKLATAPAKPVKTEPQDNEKEGTGTMTIDSPAGPLVIGNLPKVVAGDGKPADPKMSYTSEMLADGSILVTIHKTPLGIVKAAIPAAISNEDGVMLGSGGLHGFRIQGKIGNPFVSVAYENGKVTGVNWDGQTVRSEAVERAAPRGKLAPPRPDTPEGDFGIDPDDAPKERKN